jgi:hypothetical protein
MTAGVTARPLVSIVTPTLNQGGFIEQTILSIKGQTYRDVEHIVIDGGSTDGTLEILRRYDGTYPMRWISEPDRGMYDAINKGMRLASGDILAYLNSDDLYFPWTLETVVEHFLGHPETDVVLGDALGVHEQTGAEDIRFQPPYRWTFLLRAGSFVQPAVFWRRRVYSGVGEPNATLRLAGDLHYWLRMGPSCRFDKVHELLAIERDHAATKRSSEWDALMRESAAARLQFDTSPAIVRRAGLLVGRFRAWWDRRLAWARFVRRAGRPDASRRGPWHRFFAASHVRFSRRRLLLAQVPWLGRRFLPGSMNSGVDWLHAPGTPVQSGDAAVAPAP